MYYPTIIFASGKICALFLTWRIVSETSNDIGPTLPINIVKQSINLDILEINGVIPVVRPTVPKAETVSNRCKK